MQAGSNELTQPSDIFDKLVSVGPEPRCRTDASLKPIGVLIGHNAVRPNAKSRRVFQPPEIVGVPHVRFDERGLETE